MANGYIGEIRIYGFNFAPAGSVMCNGQTMSIAQNNALFALLGTIYGGNGTSTFQLPNLCGRVPIHYGQGLGLSNYVLGQLSGVEQTALNLSNLPQHNHTFAGSLNAVQTKATVQQPATGALLGRGTDQNGDDNAVIYCPAGTSGTQVALGGLTGQVGYTGAGLPVSILQPYLALNFCITLSGRFPSRN